LVRSTDAARIDAHDILISHRVGLWELGMVLDLILGGDCEVGRSLLVGQHDMSFEEASALIDYLGAPLPTVEQRLDVRGIDPLVVAS
jgi:hypothetical protein